MSKKYYICEFMDDNNEIWFQIRIKSGWWPSYYYSGHDDDVYLRDPIRFSSPVDAQNKINELIKKEKSKKVKCLGQSYPIKQQVEIL